MLRPHCRKRNTKIKPGKKKRVITDYFDIIQDNDEDDLESPHSSSDSDTESVDDSDGDTDELEHTDSDDTSYQRSDGVNSSSVLEPDSDEQQDIESEDVQTENQYNFLQ